MSKRFSHTRDVWNWKYLLKTNTMNRHINEQIEMKYVTVVVKPVHVLV